MNEIKRQLEKSMGDVSLRSHEMLQKFEQVKAQKLQKKRVAFKLPIAIAFATLTAALAFFLISTSWDQTELENTNLVLHPEDKNPLDAPTVTTKPEAPIEEEPIETASYMDTLMMYFKTDKSAAQFYGKGNGSASFRETTTWLQKPYVEIVREDWMTAPTRFIYRITNTAIELVLSETYEESPATLSLDQLNNLPVLSTVLQAPIEEGHTFDGKIIHLNAEIETFMGTYSAVMVEDTINKVKSYYQPGIGLIAEKYEADGNSVESYIANINGNYMKDLDLSVTVYNKFLKANEQYKVNDFKSIDQVEFKLEPERFNVTYAKFETVGSKEIGVFEHSCNEVGQCIAEFVIKNGSSFESLEVIHTGVGQVQFSPKRKFLLIPTHALETKFAGNSSTTITINGFVTINLEAARNGEQNISSIYGYYYPITSYKWISDNVLQIEVPDILNDDHETVYAWQNSKEQKTKTIDIKLQ